MSDFVEIHDGYDPSWINKIMEIHNKTEMKRHDAEKVNAAFSASFAVVTCWDKERLVGFGRIVSDGKMYSSIFDVVIDPDYQKRGIGQRLMERLCAKTPEACIFLTSTLGNEPFYSKLGFTRHRTAMALYPPKLANSVYLDRKWRPLIGMPMYGMIIEESLVDNRGLNDLRVTGVRITNAADLRDRWHIYSVEVTREQIDGLRKHLKPGTWYMHFWNKQDLVVIFSDKIFEMSLYDKATWRPAIEYGISRGIPEAQLDFLTE
jgi:ribosomal protein S18 acetylase RimI-like enzyme